MRRSGRVLLVVWGLVLLSGFVIALGLEPDPRGFGTHQQLGLPPCEFRRLFAIPCPSCGMTTSFSYFVRGRFLEASHANTTGLVLAVICAIQIPWCWWSAFQGRLWKVSNPEMALLCLLLVVCGVCLIHWAYQVFVN